MAKPRILLTNDDGFDAAGIQALYRSLAGDYELLIVAPLTQKSGAGCGFTVHNAFTAEERKDPDGNFLGFAVDGTPVDCVKFAHSIVTDFKADIVLSGINDGGNFGKSFWYSGTIAGAVEGNLSGYRSVAISMWNNRAKERPFDEVARYFKPLIPWFLEQEYDPDYFWNVNLPNTPGKKSKGYKFTSMGSSRYESSFLPTVEKDGKTFYQYSGGKFVRSGDEPDADDHAMNEGFASISLVSMRPAIPIPNQIAQTLENELKKLT